MRVIPLSVGRCTRSIITVVVIVISFIYRLQAAALVGRAVGTLTIYREGDREDQG